MGLDITAYSNLTHVGRHVDDWCENEDHVKAFAYDSFTQSFRGIPTLGSKQCGSATFLQGGCYAVTAETNTHAFCAGSYTGYGLWRSDLQRQFNPDRDSDAPFYELIWFADNEGSIGPDAARDLLADFRQHADRYEPGEHAHYFRKKYADWTSACELAANGGLIRFH